MRLKIGIAFFLLFIASNFVEASSSIQLKDNLNDKIRPVKSQMHSVNNEENEKRKPEESIKNIDMQHQYSKKAERRIKNDINNNAEFILNDKVLNMLKYQSMPTRPEGIIYSENQKSIDVINPKKFVNTNSNYPGLRGPNQLIIYTPSFGLRTGTNEFGTEAIVENNMVVSLNGADSIIPKNGFVISGHGLAKNWIMQNIQVGSKVYIDYLHNSIRIFLTPESLLFAAKEKIKEVNDLIEYYKNIDILYNDEKASDYLNSSKDYLRKAEQKPEKTKSYIEDAMKSLDNAIKNAIPYIDSEIKGVWLRPVEKNESEIEKTVKKLQETGITDIFLETYFHGKTIYPSEYLKNLGVIYQREEFLGFDPLEIWLREAHKNKMKVHIWFETFYVGNDNPEINPNHVLNLYPSWSNKRLYNYNSPTPVFSASEHNGYFLDPSNPQVQTYLIGIIREIITKYKPDGINLDYIRYPQTVDPSYSNYAAMNWGYTENARNEFKGLYGIDPIDIKYGTPMWKKWDLYRQGQISDFLLRVKQMTEQKNIILTAVVFPDIKKCLATKMQDWRIWSLNGYVDGLTPLILTGDKNTAELLLDDVRKNTKASTLIYPGIFVTFMGGDFDDLLLQIHKTREYKTQGLILFDYAHLSDDYAQALTTRVFNKDYEPRDVKLKIEKETKADITKKKKKKLWGRNNDND